MQEKDTVSFALARDHIARTRERGRAVVRAPRGAMVSIRGRPWAENRRGAQETLGGVAGGFDSMWEAREIREGKDCARASWQMVVPVSKLGIKRK